MNTLADILAMAAGKRARLQPHMFGASPLPPELPPDQMTDTLRALLPDPATQWMNRPSPPPPAFPLPPERQRGLTTMQRRFAY